MTIAELDVLRERITHARIAERPRLDREWQRLRSAAGRQEDISSGLCALTARIEKCTAHVAALRTAALKLEYDAELPITAHRQEILDALTTHQVIVLSGATGSGKSTQLPKLCIEAGRGVFGLIGHTQPRRIAARALANRLAEELHSRVGDAVGYQVRFTDHTGPQCRVKLMTDGILLRELEADRDLRRYDTLIIDEAHERSLNIDLLLGVLKQLLQRRADLKLIVTSATIDTQRFADFFGGAPIIEVSGRSYPVEVRYRPLYSEAEEGMEPSLTEGIVTAMHELQRDTQSEQGDVLVFLPGEKQIREVAKALQDTRLHHTEILLLYARLSVGDQEKIFARHSQRRIVLATNVAETSLTVPGIRYVIDSGLARISRYSVRGKVQRLPIEKISQASADQRKGRCGRTAPGICIRLYAEDDFMTRDAFTAPEVLRTNLASVILKLAMLRLPNPEEFPFVDRPELKLINDGYRLLQELKAVDGARQITALGKQVAALPLDPRLARMLIAADHHRCLREMLIITAFLSAQDPRERPQESQQKADQHHASYADARSDFMTVLTLWQRFHDSAVELSGNQLRKWCKQQFLSFIRVREWQEVHSQLREAVDELGLRPNQVDTSYAELHQAILTGFLGGIGVLDENREYLGARNARFIVAPGTPLTKKPPKWVVAASLVETTRTYARTVAMIEPQWIEAAGEHLLKRQYNEPHWDAARGYVTAFVTSTLYGLTLSSQRRINYASVAPEEARQIFVRAALVEGQTDIKADFLDHNRALINQIHSLEARIRRRDVLVDETTQVEFYLRHLPVHVHSATALKKWLQTRNDTAIELRMQLADLMRRDTGEYVPSDYPDHFELAGNQLALTYKFEPADADDGVTLTIPEPLVPLLTEDALMWTIPGFNAEKVTELMRALPKPLRKHLVPVPQYAAQAMTDLASSSDFTVDLARWLTQHCGSPISAAEILALPLADHLRLYVRVVDLQGRCIAQGRQLKAINAELLRRPTKPTPVVQSVVQDTIKTQGLRTWDCGTLPISRDITQKGVRFAVYPALQDRGDCVDVVDFPRPEPALQAHAMGVLRLLILALPQQYKASRQRFAADKALLLSAQGLRGAKPIIDQLTERAMRDCFLTDTTNLPRNEFAFKQLLDARRAQLHDVTGKVLLQAKQLFTDWRAVRQDMAKLQAPVFTASLTDIELQLEYLLAEGFLLSMSTVEFARLPVYVKALQRRVERLAGNAARDVQLCKQIAPYMQAWLRLRDQPTLSRVQLEKLHFMIEEFRISLFAQELKTAVSVSIKRLDEQLRQVEKDVG
jgi:ATP-dependent helicase HrpA